MVCNAQNYSHLFATSALYYNQPTASVVYKDNLKMFGGAFGEAISEVHAYIWRPGVHMKASDASVCQEAHTICVTESFLCRLTEIVMNDFPMLQVHHRIVRMSKQAVGWLEVTSLVIHLDSVLGPCDTVRMLVSQHGLCRTQVLFPFICCIAQGKWMCCV